MRGMNFAQHALKHSILNECSTGSLAQYDSDDMAAYYWTVTAEDGE